MRLPSNAGLGLAALALGWIAWRLAPAHPDIATMAVACAGAGLLVAWARVSWRGRARRAARRNAEALVGIAGETAAAHARTLAIKRNQMIVHDEYGNTDASRWAGHLAYFIERVVLRDAAAAGLAVDEVAVEDPVWLAIGQAVEAAIDLYEAEATPLDVADVRSGHDYEHFCRALLEAQGWAVAVTAGTGDQGADLVAERDGWRVVIQCKFYGRPVGNRAVQEAFAAKRFQDGDHAAVVSNSTFTRSARQLALTNDVLLLHHDQLADLDDRLRAAA